MAKLIESRLTAHNLYYIAFPSTDPVAFNEIRLNHIDCFFTGFTKDHRNQLERHAILNPANNKVIGGHGPDSKVNAAEESIWRGLGFDNETLSKRGPDYGRGIIDELGGMWSGEVREDSNLLLVISSAAPNQGNNYPMPKDQMSFKIKFETDEEEGRLLVAQVAQMYIACLNKNVTHFDITAWGQGVFANDPLKMAAAFRAVSQYFPHITTSLYCGKQGIKNPFYQALTNDKNAHLSNYRSYAADLKGKAMKDITEQIQRLHSKAMPTLRAEILKELNDYKNVRNTQDEFTSSFKKIIHDFPGSFFAHSSKTAKLKAAAYFEMLLTTGNPDGELIDKDTYEAFTAIFAGEGLKKIIDKVLPYMKVMKTAEGKYSITPTEGCQDLCGAASKVKCDNVAP